GAQRRRMPAADSAEDHRPHQPSHPDRALPGPQPRRRTGLVQLQRRGRPPLVPTRHMTSTKRSYEAAREHILNAASRNARSLDLSGNQLAILPPEIGRLSALTSLDLWGNQLAVLPPEMGDLSSTVSLHLSDNPLQEPLPSLVARGTAQLFTYLRSLSDAEAQ